MTLPLFQNLFRFVAVQIKSPNPGLFTCTDADVGFRVLLPPRSDDERISGGVSKSVAHESPKWMLARLPTPRSTAGAFAV